MNLFWFAGGFLAGLGAGITLMCCLIINDETDDGGADDNN